MGNSKWRFLLVVVFVGALGGWILHSCSPGPSRRLIQELVRSKYSEKLPASWVSAPSEWSGASGIEFTKIQVVQIGSRQQNPLASGGSYWPARVRVQGTCYSLGVYLEHEWLEDPAVYHGMSDALERRWGSGKQLTFDTVTEESVSKNPYGEWVLN